MNIWRPIASDRVDLRMLEASDAGPMALYAADVRVARMTTSIPHPYLPEMAAAYIEQVRAGGGDPCVWAIDATRSGGSAFVGVIMVRMDTSDVGYWIGPPFWSGGLATEAVQTVVRHLVETCGWRTVRAQAFADNAASHQVLGKAGFVAGATLTAYSVARGTTAEAMQFLYDADALVSGHPAGDGLKAES